MQEIVEINAVEELESYRFAWTALHAETPCASFFNTLEWLECYWRHFGEGQRLRVLVASVGGRPIGIVPFVVRREPSKLGAVRVLTYPLDYWGSVYQPVGACQSAMLTMAVRHVTQGPRDWDLFEPKWAPHERTDAGRIVTAFEVVGVKHRCTLHETYSQIDCESFQDWDAYLRSRSSKTRHEMRRKRRRLEREHEVEHVRFRPDPKRAGGGDPAWDLYRQCVEVSRKSWQARSQSGNTLCHERVSAFLEDAHGQAARLGMVDINLLMVDGRPAAYFYGYHTHGVLSGLRMGYDPDAPSGVGSVLIARVIEDSFRRGDRRIDLGVGDEHFKTKLRTSLPATHRVTHRAPSGVRVMALEAMRRGKRRLRSLLAWSPLRRWRPRISSDAN